MEKIISGIMASVFCTACIPWGNISVSASESDFISAFFPNGSINAPSRAPYVIYTDRDYDENDMTAETEMYYELSDDLMVMNYQVAVLGESGFLDEYGVSLNTEGIQIDVKFDDGAWFSESYDCNHFEYGYNIDPDGNIFLLRDYFPCSNLDRMHYLNQGWLEYYYEEDETIDFLKPYIKVVQDEYENEYYQFDTDNHRISLRYRYYITYYPDNTSDYSTGEGNVIFSEWSPESSFGAGGCQYGIGSPDGISAPSISNFSFVQNEYECYEARYFISIPQSVMEGVRYYYINEDFTEDVYEIETQVRINGGEWTEAVTDDYWLINSCYKTALYSDGSIPDNSTAEVRSRIIDIYGNESEWSNTLAIEPDYIPEYQDSFIAQALVTEKKAKTEEEVAEVSEEPVVTVVSVVGTDKHGFEITEICVVEDPDDAELNEDGSTAAVKSGVSGIKGVPEKYRWIIYTLIGLVILSGSAGIAVVLKKQNSGKPAEVSAEEKETVEETAVFECEQNDENKNIHEVDVVIDPADGEIYEADDSTDNQDDK